LSHKILVVDDDPLILETLTSNLRRAGYAVETAEHANAAYEKFLTTSPDLILLDLNLPSGDGPYEDGIAVCRAIREHNSGVPIIMHTARIGAEHEVFGFGQGADDYIEKPKPFEVIEMRIERQLKPRNRESAPIINIGPLVIDVVGHVVRRGESTINLTPLEFELLKTLAISPQRVFSRVDLLDEVWNYKFKEDARLVNVHVQRLRSKVEDDPSNPKVILTVRGKGYRAGTV
jgi:two-component system response regulator MtrA